MGSERLHAPQKDNPKPAPDEKSAAQTPAPSHLAANRSPQGLNRFSAASSESVPFTQHNLLSLQRTIGNRAVNRLIQAKLKVSQPEDKDEREADQVADRVLRMPEQDTTKPVETVGNHIQRLISNQREGLQRQAEPEEEEDRKQRMEEEQPVQAKERAGEAPSVSSNVESQIENMRGGGEPLVDSAREFFESRFGQNFGHVQVHRDTRAADSARAVNARAYTVGKDIVFGSGEYAPETSEGRKLLAHELTHVVQQSGSNQRVNTPAAQTPGHDISRSTTLLSRQPAGGAVNPLQTKANTLAIELKKLIDGAVWKEIRKRVYPKESAAGIKRAKERKTGARPDLTGLGKLATLTSFVGKIKTLQSGWDKLTPDDRVNAIGTAVNAELTAAGVPPFRTVAKAKTEWKGFFQARPWKFSISEDLVNGATLSNADAAELSNTVLHEARHAEQSFLAARFSAGPPNNKSAAAIAAEQGILEDPIAKAAVAAKFDAATDPKVTALGKEMYKANVTEGAANQQISDDDYTAEMKVARDEAITSLAALKSSATAATIADATAKRDTLKAAIAEVEKRYTLYRNIPYEADAHDVGDAAEQAFKGWP